MADVTPRKLDGYPNYEIYSDGIIYTVDTHIKVEGSITNSGYRVVTFQDPTGHRKHFGVHYLLAKLFIPKPETNEKLVIDHIDRVKTNNKIENLRWVTYSTNAQNIGKRQLTNSKYRGVYYESRRKKWMAIALKNGKRIYIGLFSSDVEAAHNFDEYMRDNNPTFTNFNFSITGPTNEQEADALYEIEVIKPKQEYIDTFCNYEKIKGFDNYIIFENSTIMNHTTGKIMKPYLHNNYYVVSFRKNKKVHTFLVHRLLAIAFIPNPDKKQYVDHKDGNKINNKLDNLRWVDRTENNQNTVKRKNTSSKYKGVHYDSRYDKWKAQIQYKGKKIYLGEFFREINAAKAYNKKAKELFGQHAQLNIIQE